jgi:uncharacterized protein YegL
VSVDYENNPNQRTPCVLVLDISYSMREAPGGKVSKIDALNEGIKALETALKDDESAISRVQLGIISVGGATDSAELMMDWTDAVNFTAFQLHAAGSTPLAEGILQGLELVEKGKALLKQNSIRYTRPWMMVITDGQPTSSSASWQRAIEACKDAEASNKVEIFAIAVEGADIAKLSQISAVRPPVSLDGLKFKELFVWLSDSLSAASRSRPGQALNLPGLDPWRNVGM